MVFYPRCSGKQGKLCELTRFRSVDSKEIVLAGGLLKKARNSCGFRVNPGKLASTLPFAL